MGVVIIVGNIAELSRNGPSHEAGFYKSVGSELEH